MNYVWSSMVIKEFDNGDVDDKSQILNFNQRLVFRLNFSKTPIAGTFKSYDSLNGVSNKCSSRGPCHHHNEELKEIICCKFLSNRGRAAHVKQERHRAGFLRKYSRTRETRCVDKRNQLIKGQSHKGGSFILPIFAG